MLRHMLRYTYCLSVHSNQSRSINIRSTFNQREKKKNTATSADFSLFEFNEFTSKN